MTWSEFQTYVLGFLPVEAQRLGISSFRDQQIRAAAIDLQSMIPALQVGTPPRSRMPGSPWTARSPGPAQRLTA